MGVLSDLLGAAETIDATTGAVGNDRHVAQQLTDIINTYGDYDYPSGYDGVNEVQSIAVHQAGTDGGHYTITVNLKSGETFTTASLLWNANATAILNAINTAASAVVGWTNGDIAVAGGHLGTTPVTLTFSGNSVKSLNHPMATIASVDLEDGGVPTVPGAVSQSTAGHTARAAWAALKMFGIVTSAPPEQGAVLTSPTVIDPLRPFPFNLTPETVRAIINEACYDDGGVTTVKTALLTALEL